MGTKPVRVSEDVYETVKNLAALHGKPVSETADLLVQTGLQNYSPFGQLELDPDLIQEWRQERCGPDKSTEQQMNGFVDITRIQMERNAERSDLDADPSQMISRICRRRRPDSSDGTEPPEPEA